MHVKLVFHQQRALEEFRIILFHQFTNIVAEEKLLDKVGLLEDGAEDDVEDGKAAGLTSFPQDSATGSPPDD